MKSTKRNLSLGTFVLINTALICLLMILIVLAVRVLVMHPAFIEQAEELQHRELESIHAGFANEFDSLDVQVDDWATWTDTADFLRGNKPEYADDNLIPEALDALKIDMLILSDLQRQPVSSTWVDGTDGSILIQQPAFIELTNSVLGNFSFVPDDPEHRHAGFTTFNGTSFLFVTRAVLSSTREGPAAGYLTMVRRVDGTVLERISRVARVDLSLLSDVSIEPVPETQWTSVFEGLQQQRHRPLMSREGRVVGVLQIRHTLDKIPERLDLLTILIISFLAVLPLLMMMITSYLILTPIRRANLVVAKMLEIGRPIQIRQSLLFTELNQLRDSFNSLVHLVEKQRVKLIQKSNIDGLTDIANRRAFQERLEVEWRRSMRSGSSLSVVMLDIDHFKLFNDSYGHVAGDDALIKVAQMLSSQVQRTSDFVARYGGEEFALILVGLDYEQLEQLMLNIEVALASQFIEHCSSPTSQYLTVSMGACMIEKPGDWMINEEPRTLLRQADEAQYLIKHSTRSSFNIAQFQPEHPGNAALVTNAAYRQASLLD
ncbi:diguanylate cyclase domain-containing protein [Nitrincola alkalilacustris]|uniref:diguanylate cyclase domain-containing protein n=1 Tax=Nitrincola alkalilacustris TaxID=1571224 RepID=UPI00124F4E1E|nr:diguanylate cyclase [Nitrincola alkalilacustris]